MFSEVLTNFEKPESKYYTQHLLLDFRDFYYTDVDNGKIYQVNNDLGFKLKVNLNELGFPAYKNVHSVELKAVSFPKMNNREIYYILDIYEFNGRLHSSDNTGSHENFAIIYYDNSSQQAGHIKPMKGKDFDEKVYIFNPVESLNTLNISFKKYGGHVIKPSDIDNTDGKTWTNDEIKTFLDTNPITILLEFKMKYI